MQHTYDPATKTHTIVHSDQEVADYATVNVDVFTRVDELVKGSNTAVSQAASNLKYKAAVDLANQIQALDPTAVTDINAILSQTTEALQAKLASMPSAPATPPASN